MPPQKKQKSPAADPLKAEYLRGEVLISQGKLKEAAAHCQQMMTSYPEDANGVFLLARIYQETGNTAKALEFVERAIALSPVKDPLHHCVRGTLLLGKGRTDEAEKDLSYALKHEPELGLAALLLGTIAIKKTKHREARQYLHKASTLGLEAEAAEQLGILLRAEDKNEEALAMFNRAIELRPGHALNYYHRGSLFHVMNKLVEAENDAKTALSINPKSEETLRLAASVASLQANPALAIQYLKQAIALKPESALLWSMIGHQHQTIGQMHDALAAYEEALRLDPENESAINTIPFLLLFFDRTQEAKVFLEKARSRYPDSAVLKHFMAYVDGEKLEAASEEYVQIVFDGYAQDFDMHLQHKLGYRMPAIIAEGLKRVMAQSEDVLPSRLSYLDLGCGTGLGAVALQAITGRRVGIDLSPKMLEKARERGLYDVLEVRDVKAYLDTAEEKFHLVTALDVFVYIGNLDPIFDAVRRVMKPRAYFAFTVEAKEDAPEGFTLLSSGRFAHSGDYIRQLAEKYGFTINLMEPAHVRLEAEKPLDGYSVILSHP